jgi:FMN phosphatase YigB (HAD superfamily)
MKPHPKVFEYAQEKTGHPSDDILYVGDSFTSDIKGGSNAGWKTAWFLRSNVQTNGKAEIADIAFSDFADLTKRLL